MKTHSHIFRFGIVSIVLVLAAVRLFTMAQESQELKPLPKFLRNPKLADRYLSTRDIDDILAFERAEPVCLQLLKRANVPAQFRLEALQELAGIRKTNPATELVAFLSVTDDLVSNAGEQQKSEHASVLADLAGIVGQLTPADLKIEDTAFKKLSSSAKQPMARQAALIGRLLASPSVDPIWESVKADENRLVELLNGTTLLNETHSSVREGLFNKVRPLLADASSDRIQRAAIESIVRLEGDQQAVFETLADFVAMKKHLTLCIRSIAQIPDEAYSATKVGALANSVLEFVNGLSIAERAAPAGIQATQLVGTLIEKLPVAQQPHVRERLRKLSVQPFVVNTVEEKMAYDKTVLVVEADRPVQITFHNRDIMPHNLVVGSEPEARIELGLLADELQTDKGALARGYVPDSSMVLFASKLIHPGKTDLVSFVAPKAGVYPFVCTFPGHWSKMYGAIKVVEDAEAYVASVESIPSADDLLGIRTVDWTYDDLVGQIDQVENGRSFEAGQRWFKRASCYSCHRMKGQGGLVGPELTEITKTLKTPTEILTHIMEPSKKIDEKFASLTVLDTDGRVHTGVLIKRTDEEIYLDRDPLQECDPTVIRLEDVEDETASRISPMPEKLLNTIVEKANVYDLLAYLISGGDATHASFQ